MTTLVQEWVSVMAPPPALQVSDWADEKRMLPESSGARGGHWRTETTPYLRGIMNAVHETGVKKIALMKSAQVGGSEALNNILGFFIEHDPCPMLLVHPTATVAEEWSKERLADMIRTTPALRDTVQDKRQSRGSHLAESTLSLKMFPGGFLALGGANTPNTFARRSVRIAIGDDVDRFPAVVGDEGDPADLLVKRTTTFHDGLVIMVSTPTAKGGRIDTLFQRSDQRRFFVRCPHCDREDWITWSDAKHFRVVYEHEDPATARLQCAEPEYGGCGGAIDEAQRRQLVAKGEWRATAHSKERGLIGFHLPAMISTLGSASLDSWVSDWLTATAVGKESLRVFVNTTLAEAWEDKSIKVEPNLLLTRREFYGDQVEVPAGAAVLTAGVDVQDDRFELQVTAWGLLEERWVVDYLVIPGDPEHASTREQLFRDLQRKYRHASGHLLPIRATCVDTGFKTDAAYTFVLAYQAHRIFGTKGYGQRGGTPIVGAPSEKTYGRGGRPVRVYPLNVDDAKRDVVKATWKVNGPGSMHFPAIDAVNEEFFAQLCAEHLQPVKNKEGIVTHTVWVQDRERNEVLDTAVLCLAAVKMLRPNIAQLLEELAKPPVQAPAPGPPAAPKPAGFLGSRRSNWLKGDR